MEVDLCVEPLKEKRDGNPHIIFTKYTDCNRLNLVMCSKTKGHLNKCIMAVVIA